MFDPIRRFAVSTQMCQALSVLNMVKIRQRENFPA
jgi:hypothetical protein